MKKIFIFVCCALLVAFVLDVFGQTTTSITGGTRSSRGTLTGGQTLGGTTGQGQADFIVALIGGMLRHPDKNVRIQAIQAIVGGMMQSTGTTTSGTTSTTSNTGIGNLFQIGAGTTSSTSTTGGTTSTSGLGGTIIIPEFFSMLSDPDQEVRDLASVAIDQIFGSDASLMRYMSDPDPVIRKYALRLFVVHESMAQAYGTTTTTGTTSNVNAGSRDILVLRVLLNMMKDPDPDVAKVAKDAIEQYISSLEGTSKTTGTTGAQPGAPMPFR